MEHVQKRKPEQSPEEEVVEAPAVQVDPEIEEHKGHTDELLDAIDALLEENAEAFVANYVQGGGE